MKNLIKFLVIFLLSLITSKSFSIELNFNNGSNQEYNDAAKAKGSVRTIQEKTKGLWPRMSEGRKYTLEDFNDLQVTENEKFLIYKTNNIPNHDLFSNNPNCATKKSYTFKIPKEIKYLEKPRKITKDMQSIGVMLNGVGIAGPYDSENKIAPYNRIVGPCGAHADPSGMYHYHFAPMCLIINGKKIGLDVNSQIGWSFDGIKIMGLADRNKHKPLIDEANGHEHDGEYHYHATIDFPFFMGAYKAKVTTSNLNQKKKGKGSGRTCVGEAAMQKGSGKGPGKKGKPKKPNFKNAEKVLGIKTKDLKKALGPPSPNPDLESAASQLNVTVEELKAALQL